MTEWIDISIPIRNGMPHWPDNPPLQVNRTMDLARADATALGRARPVSSIDWADERMELHTLQAPIPAKVPKPPERLAAHESAGRARDREATCGCDAARAGVGRRPSSRSRRAAARVL